MDPSVRVSLDALAQRIRELEANVEQLARVAGLNLAPSSGDGVPDEIRQLVLSGNRLKAIQQYRALTGAGMDEARAVIESI
jgi:ribosomal protein L7/L12